MNVIVTGGAGFIGSELVRYLIKATDHYVLNIDKLTYAGSLSSLGSISENPRYSFKKLDVSDRQGILEAITLFQPDIVFHLAAESHVDRSIAEPLEFIKTNVLGTAVMLDAVNKYLSQCSEAVKNNFRFHHISTDEVYGDRIEGSFDETAALMPSNPYAATKAAADMLVESWSRTHGLDYVIARPSNNYGENQYPEKLIPTVVRRLQRGQKIKLHNNGLPIRSWTHVEDTAEAFILLYEKACRNNIYNIQSDYEQTNLVTVTKIINAYFMGNIDVEIPDYDEHIDYNYNRPGQDIRYSISCESIKNYGWSPKKNFNKEIIKLVDYYKKRKWIW